jgi:superfamily II DNA or RNA helicase
MNRLSVSNGWTQVRPTHSTTSYSASLSPITTSVAHIRIGAMVTVTAPAAIEQAVSRDNTFPNPEFARKERLGLWTGGTDQTIRLCQRTPAGLEVPRGTLPIVIRRCRDAGVPFQIQNDTIAPPLDVPLTSGVLYEYQERGLEQLLTYQSGLLEAPTGSGKTNILLSVIPRVNTHTLILTHTKELFTQMRARCREWLGYEAGELGGGQWTVKPISVAMIQTLAKRDLSTLTSYFGCVLVDECHHAPARTWAGILNQFPARFKYGVTATAFRKDGLQIIMWRTIGNVTASITLADVTNAGKIVAPQVETVETGFYYDLEDSTNWTQMVNALVRDPHRNALIVSEVRRRLASHSRALVLSDRVEHVGILADLLANLHPVILTGKLSPAARETAMKAVREGALVTIATSGLLGEGIDVPSWDLLFLVTPMAGGPRTLQAVGRVSRAAPGKTSATVVDFVGTQVPALVVSHQLRERMYARR